MHSLHSTQLCHGRCIVQYSGKQLQLSCSSIQKQYQRSTNQPFVNSMFRCTCRVNQYLWDVFVSVVTLLFMVCHVFLLQQWLISIMTHIWACQRQRDHVMTDKSSASDVMSQKHWHLFWYVVDAGCWCWIVSGSPCSLCQLPLLPHWWEVLINTPGCM